METDKKHGKDTYFERMRHHLFMNQKLSLIRVCFLCVCVSLCLRKLGFLQFSNSFVIKFSWSLNSHESGERCLLCGRKMHFRCWKSALEKYMFYANVKIWWK